jgi:hypothetical protein
MKGKTKKEIKKPVSLTIKPSTKKRAKEKAFNQGKTLSEVAENLLYDWSAE